MNNLNRYGNWTYTVGIAPPHKPAVQPTDSQRKVMEGVIDSVIKQHLLNDNLLTDSPSGIQIDTWLKTSWLP